MRQMMRLSVLAAATMALVAACGGDDGPAAAVEQGLSCDESMKTSFKPDANTTVLQVKKVKKGDAYLGVSEQQAAFLGGPAAYAADLCMVKLLVGPGVEGPAGAPSTSRGIGIEVWLPEKNVWDHRVHAFGTPGWATGGPETTLDKMTLGSGMDGIDDSPANRAAIENSVTSITDTGIQSSGGSFALNPDRTPNAAGWRDWTYRGLYEQAVKTKALAAAYYGSAPRRAYFSGGSGGGRQALHVAQNLPEQYDGILAIVPGVDFGSFIPAVYPALLAVRELGGNDPVAQLDLASRAAVSACDMVGGRHLGFILDIKSCRYDPTKDVSVLCKADGGQNETAACLNQTQAQVMNKIWYGLTSDGSVPDPAVDNGFDAPPSGVRTWYGYPRGGSIRSLLDAFTWLGGPGVGRDVLGIVLQDPSIASPSFINATGNGQDGWKNLNYAQLTAAYEKYQGLTALYGIASNNPDLTRLRSVGTKLMHTANVHDASVWLQGHTAYYDSVVARMGGLAAVQDYYKFYALPGLYHGSFNGSANRDANPPAPAPNQTYQALVNWVENGVSPDTMVFRSPAVGSTPPVWSGFGPVVGPEMSLPACAYPTIATYVSGDVLQASSYACK